MKRTTAIVMSLMLVWLQMAAAQPVSVSGQHKQCSCCSSCKEMDCCVAQSTSTSLPPPAAPVSAATQNDFVAALSMFIAWTLPESAPLQISPADAAPSLAVPIFARHCALLI